MMKKNDTQTMSREDGVVQLVLGLGVSVGRGRLGKLETGVRLCTYCVLRTCPRATGCRSRLSSSRNELAAGMIKTRHQLN